MSNGNMKADIAGMPQPQQLGLMRPEQYQMCIANTVGQIQATNQMLEAVQKQAKEAHEAGEIDKQQESERLAMHLDLKATLLLTIVASYESAKQQAVANVRVEAQQAWTGIVWILLFAWSLSSNTKD